MAEITKFVNIQFLSVTMDVSEYNKILNYKKLSTTSSKLLNRKERHFRTELRLFTIRDGKLYKSGKQVLHSVDAYPTLHRMHHNESHSYRVQLERLARGKYHVERLRPICQRIVTQCEECQLRIEVRETGPMLHLNKRRIERLCMQLALPSNSTKPLSQAFKVTALTKLLHFPFLVKVITEPNLLDSLFPV